MRKLIISLVGLLAMHCVVAQNTDSHNFLDRILSGYVTINEMSFGIGLGETAVPFSHAVFDVTTIHGYRINKNFITSPGTGFTFYNEGGVLPLFAQFGSYRDSFIRIKTGISY